MYRRAAHLCLIAKLVAELLCTAAAFASVPDKPLSFGTKDIPGLPRQSVNQTSPRTVQLLSDALKSSEGSRRIELIADLGACQLPQAEQTLCALLDDPSPQVRAQAIRSLAEIDDKTAMSSIVSLYGDPDPSVRREAIIAGALLGDAGATATGIADEDEGVIEAACAHPVIPRSIPVLCRALKSLPTPARVIALKSLCVKEASANWKNVAACLQGTTSERYAALQALTVMDIPNSGSAIAPMLRDQSSVVRRQAVLASGQTMPPPERQQMAIGMLADRDLTVRRSAAEVIAANPTDDAIPLLIEQLSQGNGPLRDAARAALVAIGAASIPAAEKLLVDASDEAKEDGSFILGRLRSRSGLENHIALLRSSNWKVVLQAAQSLDLIGDSSAGPALQAVTTKLGQLENDNSPDANDGFAALTSSIVAAAHLGYARMLPVVEQLVAKVDCPADVRRAAIYAFGLLGRESDSTTCEQALSIAEDSQEDFASRFEAVKAIGHLRFQPAEASLAEMQETQGSLQMRWIAHWACDRIAGKSSAFALPLLNWSADVSITDWSDATNEQQLSGTLGFEGSYLAGAWVPVHLIIHNGEAQSVRGWTSFTVGDNADIATVRVPCVVPERSVMKLTAYGYFSGKQVSGQSNVATMAEWTDDDGRRLGRTPIAAVPLSTRDGFSPQSLNSLDTVILCLTEASEGTDANSSNDQSAARLAASIGERIGFAVKAEMLQIEQAPRSAAGYDSCRIILLQADPDKLDIAQRQAVIDHLRMGGELLLCAKSISPRNWLGQYQPVIPLGEREISIIEGQEDSFRHALALPSMIVEAADATGPDTRILLKDSQLIHVAYRPLGLGCVAFTSFPINALDSGDQGNCALWKNLLLLASQSSRKLTVSAAQPLGRLVGLPTEPFSMPMAIIAGYIAIVLFSQFFFSGASRPWAFVVTVGVGVIGFTCLTATNALRPSHYELNGARIILLSLGPSKGGCQEELVAFAGVENPSLRLIASRETVVRPLTSSEREEVQIQELPFEIDRACVHPMEIKQLWSARHALDASFFANATAAFGPSGLTMQIHNGLGEPIRHPLLVWNAASTLPEIGPGNSQIVPLTRKPAGDFSGRDIIHSEIDFIRSDVVRNVLAAGSSLSHREAETPLLLGWVDDLPSSLNAEGAKMNSLALVSAPVAIAPCKVGATVKIDGSFCNIISGPSALPPYDAVRHQWIPGNQSGEWIIGFAPPGGIGVLRPQHVTLNADISAPTQTITVLRGICRYGKPRSAAPGSIVAKWNQPISAQAAGFDCKSDDFDADGRVWLRLRVQSNLTTSSPWFFRTFELSYVANVVKSSAGSDSNGH